MAVPELYVLVPVNFLHRLRPLEVDFAVVEPASVLSDRPRLACLAVFAP